MSVYRLEGKPTTRTRDVIEERRELRRHPTATRCYHTTVTSNRNGSRTSANVGALDQAVGDEKQRVTDVTLANDHVAGTKRHLTDSVCQLQQLRLG